MSPWRWKVERLFCDVKAVVHLHRFYLSSPNGVAMQVSAAALVPTAFRVAPGQVTEAVGIAPEEMSPAKCFPRLAVAAIGRTWAELAFLEIPQANAGITLQQPHWQHCRCAWTTVGALRGEPRKGRRKKRRFCQSRKHWKSFAHIPGGKKLT